MATQIRVDCRLVAESDMAFEIARLSAAIDGEASTVDETLGEHPCRFERGDLVWAGQTEHRELRRQLGALRATTADAQNRGAADPRLLRAELATLLSFAKTLTSDAVGWRADFEARLRELAVREAAAREERARTTAEREAVIRRRDALQASIDGAASAIVRDGGGEHRRTVPCISVGERATVVSQWVSCPRRGFRPAKHWLVTLDRDGDRVLIRRCYA